MNSYASNMSKTFFLIAMHSSEVLKKKKTKKKKFYCGFREQHDSAYADSQSFIWLKCKYSMTNSFGLQKNWYFIGL